MNNITRITRQTVGRILEEAAYIFTDDLDEKEKPDVAEWEADGVSLVFSGSPNGQLRMWVSKGFACYAAANMLGIDVSTEEAQQKGLDALKELLNMVVGNFITAAFGDTCIFELGLPVNLDKEKLLADASHQNAFWLEAEGNLVLFVIEVDK